MVVEGDGHAIPEAGEADRIRKGGHDLVLRAHALAEGLLRLCGRAGKAAVLRSDLVDVRDFLGIDGIHGVKPPLRA